MVFRPRPAAQEPPRRVPLVITTPADVRAGNLTIRGTDRNKVVLDGQFELENGIFVPGTDGVVVETPGYEREYRVH